MLNYIVEGELQRIVLEISRDFETLIATVDFDTKLGLPSRGQRTRTNARTRRGKRIAVGGTAKKAVSKLK